MLLLMKQEDLLLSNFSGMAKKICLPFLLKEFEDRGHSFRLFDMIGDAMIDTIVMKKYSNIVKRNESPITASDAVSDFFCALRGINSFKPSLAVPLQNHLK
jgi:hypothetical protein